MALGDVCTAPHSDRTVFSTDRIRAYLHLNTGFFISYEKVVYRKVKPDDSKRFKSPVLNFLDPRKLISHMLLNIQ